MKIALVDKEGRVLGFEEVPEDYKLRVREKAVEGKKPEPREGYEFIGPDYRIEPGGGITAYWTEQPIDEMEPSRLLDRLKRLEKEVFGK